MVPGSKSHTIRAVAVATMAPGISTIRYPLASEDALSALFAAQKLGAEMISQTPEAWVIRGIQSFQNLSSDVHIDVGNSGTSLRIFTALAALASATVHFDGDASLRTRVMAPVLNALSALGSTITSTNMKCPLSVRGPIHGGNLTIEAVSSQYLTALLFAAPLIDADETEITVSHLNEKPYVRLTLDWLDAQKIRYEMRDDMMYFKIPGRQKYTPFDRAIPADFSTATFPLVAGLITRSPMVIQNLDFTDSQGDKAVFKIAAEMGATLLQEGNSTTVLPPSGPLRAIPKLDLNNTPDALPALAVLACFADGVTEIVNTPQARIKETDRISCMTAELSKMGADITETPEGMIIRPVLQLNGAEVSGHSDHRIVMALALAALRATDPVTITTAESAMVTYPDFVKDFTALGANFQLFD